MTLRVRLVLALLVAALVPTALAIAVPWFRAEGRARRAAEGRLDLAARQAALLIERHALDSVGHLEQAVSELSRDRSALQSLFVGPDADARGTARGLAERNDLDYLEVLGSDDSVISSSSQATASGTRSRFAEIPRGESRLLPLPGNPARRDADVAIFSRSDIDASGERLSVVGARAISHEVIDGIAAITGGPAALVDPSGVPVEMSQGPPANPDWLSVDEPVGGGWAVRVWVPGGDVLRERRDLLGVFAGVLPLALASVLFIGVLLAEGISRPIRALASRAEKIASESESSFTLLSEKDEVARLTRSFDRMLLALSHSEQQRLSAERIAAWQEMAQRIAHEVKNPLSPIKLAVENLQRTRRKAPQEFDRALEEESATILEEVESLRRLVDEFSNFARMPAARPVPCDPGQVIEQALALFASRIEMMEVTVDKRLADGPESILADPDQLGRALKNLLANALEAMESVTDRRLELSLRQAESDQGAIVEIEVRDSGAGFEPDALRRVFEPYFTTRAERGGTGLGMAIVYRIAREHGGTVVARSRPGEGARITLRFPVRGAPTRRA